MTNLSHGVFDRVDPVAALIARDTMLRRARYHYVLDCDNTNPRGVDILTTTTDEALALVDCTACVHEMYEAGILSEAYGVD